MVGGRAEQKGLEFLIRQNPDLPHTLIGDPVRLGQILANLCGNSVKFTEKGEVELAIDVEQSDDDKIILKFSVRDTGIGIDLADDGKNKLFQKFSQVDQSSTRRYGGTGLGLAVSRHLTQLMGGEIWLEKTEINVGTIFCFTLPFGIVNQTEKSHRRLLEELIPKLKGLKALIVDDNHVAREILRDMLEEFRFEVRSVKSGEETLVELESQSYDIVLMDWNMPGMHGDEATTRIYRDTAIQPKPKVIMVTAYGREEVFRVAEQAGVDGFLLKPVTPSTLLDAIMTALGLGRSGLKKKSQLVSDKKTAMISFRGTKVLLVEDNDVNREFATELLVSFNVEVDHANNGEVALARVQQRNYDAVLMDIQMPVMDGYEATGCIRSLAAQPDGARFEALPIIAMTAQALVGDRDQAIHAGMNDYISKPIDPVQLINLLQKWLGIESEHTEESYVNIDEEIFYAIPDDLEKMVSIDAEKGLRRIAGNERAYRKMLNRFYENYADKVGSVRELISNGHLLEANSLCHSLQGAVGNFGADQLFRAAATINNLLKREILPDNEQLQVFETLLQQLLDDIAHLFSREEDNRKILEVSVDKIKLLGLLADLKKSIDDDLVVAQGILDEVTTLVDGSEWATSIKPISEQVEEFNTDAARILIQHMEERLV
jgi:CheY-like chemotaxis protein/HPt (histidine-containing phosphotransfer) domain-containing protein